MIFGQRKNPNTRRGIKTTGLVAPPLSYLITNHQSFRVAKHNSYVHYLFFHLASIHNKHHIINGDTTNGTVAKVKIIPLKSIRSNFNLMVRDEQKFKDWNNKNNWDQDKIDIDHYGGASTNLAGGVGGGWKGGTKGGPKLLVDRPTQASTPPPSLKKKSAS